MTTPYQTELELIPSLKGAPLFKSREEQEKFEKRFYDEVAPALREQAIAKALSEEAARHRLVD